MKSVLISIQPKWCELIASGKKTVEVRKTRPKIEAPFKCYIYCTHNNRKNALHLYVNSGYGRKEFGVIGQWRSGKEIVDVNSHLPAYRYSAYLAEGKVIGEFVCDKIDTVMNVNTPCMVYFTVNDKMDMFFSDISCLDVDELGAYIGFNKEGYGWHISDLKIYDEPKELSEFKKWNRTECAFSDLGYAIPKCSDCHYSKCMISSPPQSWYYVEALQ